MSKKTAPRSSRAKMRCSLEEFESAAKEIKRMSPERLEAAKKAMVYGVSQQLLADSLNCTRSNINKSVSKVWGHVEAKRNQTYKPAGWVVATVTAPRDLLRKFKRSCEQEYERVTMNTSHVSSSEK